MSAAERQRRQRQRRGRGRPTDVAYMVSLPVTYGDLDAMVKLGKLPSGKLDKGTVTATVGEIWAHIEIEKK